MNRIRSKLCVFTFFVQVFERLGVGLWLCLPPGSSSSVSRVRSWLYFNGASRNGLDGVGTLGGGAGVCAGGVFCPCLSGMASGRWLPQAFPSGAPALRLNVAKPCGPEGGPLGVGVHMFMQEQACGASEGAMRVSGSMPQKAQHFPAPSLIPQLWKLPQLHGHHHHRQEGRGTPSSSLPPQGPPRETLPALWGFRDFRANHCRKIPRDRLNPGEFSVFWDSQRGGSYRNQASDSYVSGGRRGSLCDPWGGAQPSSPSHPGPGSFLPALSLVGATLPFCWG